MGRSGRGGRDARAPRPAAVVVVDVKTVSNPAFVAGLTVDEAQRVLIEAAQWRYPEMRCSAECGVQPHVVVDYGWRDRSVLYCCGCQHADLWV